MKTFLQRVTSKVQTEQTPDVAVISFTPAGDGAPPNFSLVVPDAEMGDWLLGRTYEFGATLVPLPVEAPNITPDNAPDAVVDGDSDSDNGAP